jgi:flagellar biosynthesis protein FlhG
VPAEGQEIHIQRLHVHGQVRHGLRPVHQHARAHGVGRVRVLANRTREPGEGLGVFQRLERVTQRYLDVVLDYVGEIPDDAWLSRSIREQRPVLEAYPSSRASQAFKKLARLTDTWPVPTGPRGHLEFFVERLVRRPGAVLEVVQ